MPPKSKAQQIEELSEGSLKDQRILLLVAMSILILNIFLLLGNFSWDDALEAQKCMSASAQSSADCPSHIINWLASPVLLALGFVAVLSLVAGVLMPKNMRSLTWVGAFAILCCILQKLLEDYDCSAHHAAIAFPCYRLLKGGAGTIAAGMFGQLLCIILMFPYSTSSISVAQVADEDEAAEKKATAAEKRKQTMEKKKKDAAEKKQQATQTTKVQTRSGSL